VAPLGIISTPEINAFSGGESEDPGIINAVVRGGEGGGNAFSFNSTVLPLSLCGYLAFFQPHNASLLPLIISYRRISSF
jgi:hypothetical protein